MWTLKGVHLLASAQEVTSLGLSLSGGFEVGIRSRREKERSLAGCWWLGLTLRRYPLGFPGSTSLWCINACSAATV